MADNSIVALSETTDYTINSYSLDNERSFVVDFEGISIIQDGDAMGDGEFMYDIKIVNQNGTAIHNIKNISIIQASDDGFINIDNNTKVVKMNNTSGQFFKIMATLTEDDSPQDNVVIGPISSSQYSYPWSNIPTGRRSIEFKKDNVNAILYYSIKQQ